MNDCPNIVVREQLPDFIHGSLDPQDQRVVQSHLDTCADCAAELALLQAIRASRDLVIPTPAIDVSHIVSALPAYEPRARVTSHPVRLAAGLLIAAVGIATLAVTRDSAAPNTVPQSASVNGPSTASTVSEPNPSISPAPNGIALVSVDALSDEQLEELITEVKTLEPSTVDIDDPYELDLTGRAVFRELEDI